MSEICTHMFWSEKANPVYGTVFGDCTIVLALQEIHSLPTENSVGNINNSVGN